MSTPTSVQIIPGNLVLSGNVDTNDTDNTFCIDRANGRVGIGQGLTSLVTDSNDSNVLQISGEVKATRFHGDGSGITGLTDSKWLENDNDINNIYYSAGNVGIGGTGTSNANLDVVGSARVSNAVTIGTTKTYVVTVQQVDSVNKYFIDGVDRPVLQLHQRQRYIFDVSSLSAGGHVFAFSQTLQGTHGGGVAYDTGISRPTNQVVFDVPVGAPSHLYYYCTNSSHTSMGSDTPSEIYSTAELIVSGRVVPIDLHVSGTRGSILGSGNTSQRGTNPILGTIRYNTTIGFMEAYTDSGWGTLSPPPSIVSFSPAATTLTGTSTQVFTVTGTGFVSGSIVQLEGADGTLYSVVDVTGPNADGTEMTFKLGDLTSATAQVENQPYKVRILNASAVLYRSSADRITFLSPTITGVSPTTLAYSAVGSQTITVTGTNFVSSMANGNNIQVLGTNGSTLYSVDSAAFVSTTSITFKLVATGGTLSSGQLTQRPYKVKVIGTGSLTATSTQTIGFTGLSWTSPAAGAILTFNNLTSTSVSLAGTDAVGGTDRTFEVAPGSTLPSNLALNESTGVLSGTIPTPVSTNVTFRVVDTLNQAFLERIFNIVGIAFLYPFTTHTFTNAGKTGRDGPSLSALQSSSTGYGTTGTTSWVGNSNYFNVSGGIQQWTVPRTGSYRVEIAGAKSGANQGLGVVQVLNLNFTKSEILKICVGQRGGSRHSSDGGGGGGGSFLVKNNNTLLCASGGGGGFGDATVSGSGGSGAGSNGGAGGSNGGGGVCGLNGPGQSGAGFSGNGATGSQAQTGSPPGDPASSFLNGCVGGRLGTSNGGIYDYSVGGFGGGGAGFVNNASGRFYRSGGGGGYSGGGGGGYNGGNGQSGNGAGGGGSYSLTTVTGSSLNYGDHGYVTITKL